MQNEEQFAALFALILNSGNCFHKIVITKKSTQFFLATVKRPSGDVEPVGWKLVCVYKVEYAVAVTVAV